MAIERIESEPLQVLPLRGRVRDIGEHWTMGQIDAARDSKLVAEEVGRWIVRSKQAIWICQGGQVAMTDIRPGVIQVIPEGCACWRLIPSWQEPAQR